MSIQIFIIFKSSITINISLTLCLLDPSQSGEVEVGGYLRADGELIVSTNCSEQFETLHSEAAVVQTWFVCFISHANIQVELLQ